MDILSITCVKLMVMFSEEAAAAYMLKVCEMLNNWTSAWPFVFAKILLSELISKLLLKPIIRECRGDYVIWWQIYIYIVLHLHPGNQHKDGGHYLSYRLKRLHIFYIDIHSLYIISICISLHYLYCDSLPVNIILPSITYLYLLSFVILVAVCLFLCRYIENNEEVSCDYDK